MKTLDFLRWLGVDVPRWIENDLKHAADPLEASYQQALTTATELMAYCRTLGVPFGINVESVSIRRVEIEAAVQLAYELRRRSPALIRRLMTSPLSGSLLTQSIATACRPSGTRRAGAHHCLTCPTKKPVARRRRVQPGCRFRAPR